MVSFSQSPFHFVLFTRERCRVNNFHFCESDPRRGEYQPSAKILIVPPSHKVDANCELSYAPIVFHGRLISVFAFQFQSHLDPLVCDLAEKVCRSRWRA